MSKDPGRILIFDTTLRDGEQSPGASLNLEEKLAIAHQLARLGEMLLKLGFLSQVQEILKLLIKLLMP